jgi:hypothetical protein
LGWIPGNCDVLLSYEEQSRIEEENERNRTVSEESNQEFLTKETRNLDQEIVVSNDHKALIADRFWLNAGLPISPELSRSEISAAFGKLGCPP